jgi:hypothetical protein
VPVKDCGRLRRISGQYHGHRSSEFPYIFWVEPLLAKKERSVAAPQNSRKQMSGSRFSLEKSGNITAIAGRG